MWNHYDLCAAGWCSRTALSRVTPSWPRHTSAALPPAPPLLLLLLVARQPSPLSSSSRSASTLSQSTYKILLRKLMWWLVVCSGVRESVAACRHWVRDGIPWLSDQRDLSDQRHSHHQAHHARESEYQWSRPAISRVAFATKKSTKCTIISPFVTLSSVVPWSVVLPGKCKYLFVFIGLDNI